MVDIVEQVGRAADAAAAAAAAASTGTGAAADAAARAADAAARAADTAGAAAAASNVGSLSYAALIIAVTSLLTVLANWSLSRRKHNTVDAATAFRALMEVVEAQRVEIDRERQARHAAESRLLGHLERRDRP